jgi:hypothetical protein
VSGERQLWFVAGSYTQGSQSGVRGTATFAAKDFGHAVERAPDVLVAPAGGERDGAHSPVIELLRLEGTVWP